MKLRNVVVILLLSAVFGLYAGEQYCQFVSGKWNQGDWLMVKSPRWPNIGAWEQESECITNRVPKDATAKELLGKRHPETYTSMVWRAPISGNSTVTVKMSFDDRMAPEIVLAGLLGADKDGYPEYREHWEIVLFDEGLNVWHHEFKDGKPFWRKAAFVKAAFEPKKVYELSAQLVFTSKVPLLTVTCGEHQFGCMLPTLPAHYSVGITGCEGVNRFYDFRLKSGK